jgi:hypothetical protein
MRLTQCGNIQKSTEDIRTIITTTEREIKEELDALINTMKPTLSGTSRS